MRILTAVVLVGTSVLMVACDTTPQAKPKPTPTAPTAPVDADRDARMGWWRDARFGMFIHWGIYSVAAGEWKGQPTKGAGEWIMHTESIPIPEYEPLAARFNPVQFDAREWVRVAKDAGMKYVVITSKHHDGFAMFKTATESYNIVDGTPYGRDPMKELAQECERQGLRFCFYHSIMDWHHPDFNEAGMDARYIPYMKTQLRELLTNYGSIGVLWFDGEWPNEWTEARGEDLATYVRGLQPRIIINNRVGKARAGMSGRSSYQGAGDFDTPEQEIPATGLPGADWETCMTMNDTWGFSAHDQNWKSARTLIRMLCDTSSKGGNFLLNVGPTAMGVIPPESVERLAAVGRWTHVNGEAVYGTGASPVGRVPWGRCTTKGEWLYLMVFDWPADGRLLVPGLRNGERASMLSGGTPVGATQSEEGLRLTLTGSAPDADATVIKVKCRGTPRVERLLPSVGGNETALFLSCLDADTTARTEDHDGEPNIGYWTREDQKASWEFNVSKPGRFRVQCLVACEPGEAGDAFTVTCQGASVRAVVPATAGWDDFSWLDCGEIDLARTGPSVFVIAPAPGLKGALMNLRSVRVTPVSPR